MAKRASLTPNGIAECAASLLVFDARVYAQVM
jgi:hypothetical protein